MEAKRLVIAMVHVPATVIARKLLVVLAAALITAARPAQAALDYTLLDDVLIHNVRNGYVDYDGIAVNPRFAQFLQQLATEPVPTDKPAALAHLINAYNAFAISGILQGYSPGTRQGRWRYFERLEFPFAGGRITLEVLEHQRIRTLNDARIHFAIICASLSCPRLVSRAYRPETLDAQLQGAAEGFINDYTRNRFDVAQKSAFLSPIFDWFAVDFERDAGSVTAYLARFVQDPAGRAALKEGRLQLQYLDYDWGLNGRFTGESR
jgi:hypothetical protein